MQPSDTPTPILASHSLKLPSPTRQALLEQLEVALKPIESNSFPPPKVEREKALWFHRHELQEVNKTWETSGITGVLARWGETRTFATGLPISLKPAAHEVSPDAPTNPCVLLVYEYKQELEPNPVQQNYFRFASLSLSESVQDQIKTELAYSGLLAKLRPAVDYVTRAPLDDAPITGVWCGTEWYGPDNYYGDGSTLRISLVLEPKGHESEELRLGIDKRGSISRCLWRSDYCETGYEGHEHLILELNDRELSALLPLISRITQIKPDRPSGLVYGFWMGNSFF